MRGGMVVPALLLAAGLAGCIGGSDTENAVAPAAGAAWTPCEHPWPCGDGSEWPAGLEGPFELATREHLRIDLETGVTLDGAVWWPDVPDGVDVPLVLWATPYAGQCRYSRLDDTVLNQQIYCDDPPYDSDVGDALFGYLGSHGFAFAMFNVRGTGLSSGCFQNYGSESRADLAALVEQLAALDGVNGRVGMWGISAMGGTQFMAAVEAPPSLKAILPSGIITDLYLNRFTPQGAMPVDYAAFGAGWPTFNSVVPAGGALKWVNPGNYQTVVPIIAENAAERGCPDAATTALAAGKGAYTDDRDAAFWNDRNMAPLLDDIEAAVMVQQGLFEAGHAFQEDAIWDRINAPKRMLIGPWGHNLVVDDHLAAYVGGNTTQQVILDWFDFWLKGIGEPPRVGVVDVQDTGGAWMELDAWPPEVTQELLYLTSDGLQPEASGGATSFIGLTFEDGAPCDLEADRADLLGARVVYASEPLSSPVSLVGNPMAYLQVTSSQAGGLLALDLYHVGPGGLCDEPVRLSWGGGDLRHLDGNGTGRPFPTGQATPVRIDLAGMAVPIPSGDRLALVASSTGAFEYRGGPYTPTLAIEGVSHIVLPLLEGSLGGHAPTMDYPPRPRMDP